VTVGIETGVVNGKFLGRSLGHVLEWCGLHRAELIENWDLAAKREALRSIEPLE
jgi:hypothetical protein